MKQTAEPKRKRGNQHKPLLDDDVVYAICVLRERGGKLKDIAAAAMTCVSNVSMIVNNKRRVN